MKKALPPVLSFVAFFGPGALALQAQEEMPAGTILGMVYDSTVSQPLAGADIAILGTSARSESDENGEFRIDEVPPGVYSITFFHPRLGTLGVNGNSQRVAVVGGEVSETYLSVPSKATILDAWCSAAPGEGNTSVGGVVTDRLTGVPLPDARVEVLGARSGLLQRQEVVGEVTTGNSGEYTLCNVEFGEDLTVNVTFGNNSATPVTIGQPGAHVLDVAIPIAEPVSITGAVADYATGAPVAGASVRLEGSDFQAFADTSGRFAFANVPPGKQVIVTEQLGYATRTDSLTVFSREALGLEIVLSTKAIALDPIVVTGRRRNLVLTTPGTRFSGLTEAQVDSIIPRAFDFGTLARAARVPGVSITTTNLVNSFGNLQEGLCIEMLRGRGLANTCNMVEVRINDGPLPDPAFFLLELNPQDVKSIQFITPIEAGLLYGDRGTNGVLLIYTR